MFHWKHEGSTLRQGFNVYHPYNTHSIGFVLRVGNYVLRARWSKHAKRFFGGVNKIDPNAWNDFINQ